MSTFLEKKSALLKTILLLIAVVLLPCGVQADNYQLPDPGFEDWSGAAFDGNAQPKYWHGSNVEQVGFKFNFTYKEAGRSGSCVMVQDKEVGAMGITEVGPGYFSMGTAWQYLSGLNTGSATAGTVGGHAFTHRPDSISVWIKRTGDNTDKEDFHILYYSWYGTAQGSAYKSKSGNCTSVSQTDEESDIRTTLDWNECNTTTPGNQVAEGWLHTRAYYGEWTNIRIPIYYMNDKAPEKCNVIFSASNYPNFRANSGLYKGNSLYVDDVELIYSSKIQELKVGGKTWKGFDPNSSEVQYYSLGESATSVPDMEAFRGIGTLSNVQGQSTSKSFDFPGRMLSGSEISIVKGDLDKTPTTITVKAEDGSSTTVYKIQFQKAASSNAKLANISYTYTDKDGNEQSASVTSFNPSTYTYKVELPYGTKGVPVVSAEAQEDGQTVKITQAGSLTGTATIDVTAANGSTKATYKVSFEVGKLADNTLQGILVNGNPIPGFTPSQAIYKVSLPTETTVMPTVEAVSAYPKGEQTIVYEAPSTIDGGQYKISVTTPGNSVAKVYKLNFKLEASSYSFLADLKVTGDQIQQCTPSKPTDNTQIDFSPENTTYYVNLLKGTKSLPSISWTVGEKSQTVKKADLPEGSVDGTVRVTVIAGNGVDQTVYKLIFSTEKSSNSKLESITLGGEPLPGFDPDVTNYTYTFPVGTKELPEIGFVKGDEEQEVAVSSSGVNGKTRLTVTAGDGSVTIYQIAFSVQTFNDNTLKSLSVAGNALCDEDGNAVSFDPEVNEYWVNLVQGTSTLPEVSYELQSADFQSASVRTFSGLNGDYKITVRPQTGASRTYIIHFSVATSSNTKLAMIYLDGKELEGFDPAITEYVDTLPAGTTELPVVTFKAAEPTQRVVNVREGKTQYITVTAENGKKREYKILFVVRVSTNAYLNQIYLDGDTIDGFRKDSFEYVVTLQGETCPKITVDADPSQQVTITAPYSVGKALISVKPEEGEANSYSIVFEKKAVASAQLKMIYIDGVEIDGFAQETKSYFAHYEQTLPTVTYALLYPEQKAKLLWKGDTARIYVRDTLNNFEKYSIEFTRVKSSNDSLLGIYADGVLIDGFRADSLHYAYELEAGAAYPEISYKSADATQVTLFGQLGEGKWGITIEAENGAKKSYTVAYTHKKYSDATLAGLAVEAMSISFDPNTTEYYLTIDEGAKLPRISVTQKPGQTIGIYTANDSTQRVEVMAEDSTQNSYTIHYSRKISSSVELENIYVESKPLLGFDPAKTEYTYLLPRGTKSVPNVNAVAKLDNQTITTYFCRPNGTTKIHVEAQNGDSRDYLIHFPVEKLENTKLDSLFIDGVVRDVNVTEYEFTMPYGSTSPYAVRYKAAEGQLVRFIDAPLSGVTKIIVTSETDERTYSIRYKIAEPEGTNAIKEVYYSYTDKDNTVVNGSLVPVKGDNVIELPYGSKQFSVDSVSKSYAEQNVIFYNGGIRRGAKIIAVANQSGVDDVEYTITPKMPEFDTKGKLKELRFNGELVPHWRPDVYNYIINVTDEPTAEMFTYEAIDSIRIVNDQPKKVIVNVSAINSKKKHISFTVAPLGKTYNVYWFYSNDKDPFDFSADWVNAGTTGSKPSNEWKVIADYSAGHYYAVPVVDYPIPYTTGLEVSRAGTNAVLLSTNRQGAIRASVPGMMTLGEMTVDFQNGSFTPSSIEGCNSTTGVTITETNGMVFRNTPEHLAFQYKPISGEGGINAWSVKVWLTGKDKNDNLSMKEFSILGNYESDALRDTTIIFKDSFPTGNMAYINATLNSCSTENAKQMGTLDGNQNSRLLLQNMHLTYNSLLKSATLDDKTTVTPIDNVIRFNVDESYVGVPALSFAKSVDDQTQTIKWDEEWKNGELKAKVVNYGENALDEKRDSTVYTVVLHRDAVTSLDYTIDTAGYTMTMVGDSVFIERPYGVSRIEDLHITPASIHQKFDISKKGNAITVTVTNEKSESKTTVYVFRETQPDVVDIEWGDAVDLSTEYEEIDPENHIYTVETDSMPSLYFKKKDIGQTVDFTWTDDSATFVVTAANGEATRTYTIRRVIKAEPLYGKIRAFYKGGVELDDFGMEKDTTSGERTNDLFTFERQYSADSVVYVQTPDSMEWQVVGSTRYVYRYSKVVSDNKELFDLLVDGKSYLDTIKGQGGELTLYVESLPIVEAIAAELSQTITTDRNLDAEGLEYVFTVKAENATQRTYKLSLPRAKSNDASLAGIMVDSVLISGFNPDQYEYEVVLPSPKVKVVQPQMPDITYLAGHKGQTIVVEKGELNGVNTVITVQSESGDVKDYSVKVSAEKSSCTELTGIIVNGEAIDRFNPKGLIYSKSLKTNEIEIDYTSDDRFQKVTITIDTVEVGREYNCVLNVEAENGETNKYEVAIYVENQSSDTQLANILLNGKSFEDFEQALNPKLKFDAGNNSYEINLPSGTTILPEVSAQLKMEGQSVDIEYGENAVLLDVYAVDKSKNTYTLNFSVPKSKNADLSMIFIDGDSLPDFDPTYYFYQVTLPVGVHTMPEVVGQKGEASQTILSQDRDEEKLQTTIKVQAEDTTVRENTYVVVFHMTQSDADTLDNIYADGQPLADFEPQNMYYTYSLPVRTAAFPELSWQEADDWQTVKLDTVEQSANTLIRQILVTSESGKKNTYTVSYTIEKSDVDTLQMIFINQLQLDGFKAGKMEYSVTLSAEEARDLDGQMPEVDYISGDDDQTVMVSHMPEDSLSTDKKSLGNKSVLTVTAATGKMRKYFIHYPVEKSTDATLNMINLGGKPLTNYDAERFYYRVEIAKEAAIPVVSVIKKDNEQTYEIRVVEDTVEVAVWAESGVDSVTYTLMFERLKSANTLLRDVVLTTAEGEAIPASEFPFRPEVYSYIVNVAYDPTRTPEELLPTIEPVFYEEEQTADTTIHRLSDGDIQVDITVTAPNEEDQAIYSIIFHFLKPTDATIASLMLRGEELAGFRPSKTEYTYIHPYGTDSADYFTVEDVTMILSDPLATDSIFMDDYDVINVVVTAQDGRTTNTYLISQTTAEDGDNALAWIKLDGKEIVDFDPEVLFYTYYVRSGESAPSIEAEARSENAEVEIGRALAGDTCTITCTAADGTDRYYMIYFAESEIKPGEKATAGDVLMKRMPGSYQILVATVRNGITFALYDQYGHMVFYERVPVANPNDAEMVMGADNKEYLNNVSDTRSGLVVDLIPGQPYFYSFYADEKTKLESGKFIAY